MDWILLLEILYAIGIIGIMLKVIEDTHSVTKTLAYLLVVVFLPFLGAFVYFHLVLIIAKTGCISGS